MSDAFARAAYALLDEAIAAAMRAGAEYVEARWVDTEREDLRVRALRGGDPTPEAIERRSSAGFGVRVIASGAWGFACTPNATSASVVEAAKSAVAIARATAALQSRRVQLAELPPSRGTYRTAVEVDPFVVPLARKVEDLVAPTRELLRAPRVRSASAAASWTRVRKALVTSEGTRVAQELVYGGAEISATAIGDDGRAQRRSFPAAHGGDAGQGGYERVAALRLEAHAPRVRDEAVALLDAPALPVGRRTIVLESSQLALQIHESCGHPTELDRALGTEISLAGGSFLQPSMLGSFRYGSPQVNLVADATAPGGLGTFGWDDEGVPAQTVDLVREGVFTGYLSSRETAREIGRTSSGAMRAESWNRVPLIRMVNVSLLPGPSGDLEALVADTEDGVLFETNKSWSIDDLRLHFQFGCEVAWEIKNGKRVRMFRDPVYASTTPELWRRCDAVCDEREFRLWGVVNCGKGDPLQLMQVGHGASAARFRDVEVGHS